MHIKYHITIGIFGSIFLNNFIFFIGSIILDIPLLWNEIRLWVKKEEFDPKKIGNKTLNFYRLTHSLFFMLFMFFMFGREVASAILCHQIMDWGSHVGLFRTMLFFPISRRQI